LESEEKFKSITERIYDLIVAADIEGNISYVSPSVIRIFGYQPEELIGRNIMEFVPKAEIPYVIEIFRISGSGKNIEGHYSEFIKKDGLIANITISAVPIFENDEIIGAQAIIHDITERKQAEEEIKESEERYRGLSEAAFDAIFISEKGVCLEQNSTAEKMFGYTISEAIGRKGTEWITPEDREMVMNNMLSGYEEPYEATGLRKDGSTFPADIQGKMMYYRGRAVRVTTMTDITERKQVQEVLEENEERYRQIFQFSPDSIIILDMDMNIMAVNNKVVEEFGYSKKELLEKTIFELHPETELKHSAQVLASMKKKGMLKVETSFIRKDGSVFLAEATPCNYALGGKQIIHVVIRDITERKRAEKSLEQSESLLKAIIDSTGDGLLVVDNNGHVTHRNTEFIKMWNIPQRLINTAEDSKLIDFVLSQLIEPEKFSDKVKELYKSSRSSSDIIYFKDGRVFERNSQPLLVDNVIAGRVWDFSNITERKRAEQIQKVLYNISNAVITSDNLSKLIRVIQIELGTVIDTTNFYIALYDIKADTLTSPFFIDEKDKLPVFPAGKTLTHYVIKTQKSLLATKEVLEILEQRGEVESFGTNSEIWLGVPLEIEGKVTGVLAVQSYTDEFAYDESDMEILEFVSDQVSISIDRKKAEEDLITAMKNAEESDRLKSAFLANMSHEIRTPMNGILGFADLLKEPGLSGDEQQEYIRIIENSSKRMLNTINDLMDISMVESGQVKVSISDTNINEKIENLYSFFKPEVERKGMRLSLNNSHQKKEVIVKTDKEKVYAILTNLIKNAIKYSHEGSIEFGYVLTGLTSKSEKVREPAKPTDTKPVEVEFFVKDTGIGIPKNRQQAIFDRFVQADIEDKAAYEGSGLGLSISKAYVEMLGGKIWVESEEGIGSQFYFTIPYGIGKKDVPESKLAKSEAIPEKQLKKLKILIAEDDKSADIHLSILTKKISKEILHAKSGTETVDICRNNPDIDLVLMDIRMPEMDGYEATREIREFNKDIVIIAQTAYALAGNREEAIEAGCDDYVSKPIKQEVLMAKIVKWLSS